MPCLPTLKIARVLILFFFCFGSVINANAQMRQVSIEPGEAANRIFKISFYTANEGYVGYRDWVGYTTDTGRTFTKKVITGSNVNYGTFSVNLTFGFYINGVKAFSRNNLLVYGHYGGVPAVLRSLDGGNFFTLVYHSQLNPLDFGQGMLDMLFPENNSVGFAVDADRILKTTNQGQSWSTVYTSAGSLFFAIEAVDNSNVFVVCYANAQFKLLKSSNGGSTWTPIAVPALPNSTLNYAFFLNTTTGWISMSSGTNGYIYKTTNGGASWLLQNDVEASSFASSKFKFIDDNVGYALAGLNIVAKTSTSGKIWEPLPRDNSFVDSVYSHIDLHFFSPTQFWAGGGKGFLELTTNGGGTPLPMAYFKIDTTGIYNNNIVNLINYSATNYSYQWFLNNTLISTSYNASYVHDIFRLKDTLKLVVSSGGYSDTSVKYVTFNPPVIVSAFTPTSAGAGTTVTITGLNLFGATAVSFGNMPAASFTITSPTSINAVVGAGGASGSVRVTTSDGSGALAGFTFVPPPTITSFTPSAGTAGSTITITGTNFLNATAVLMANVPASSYTPLQATIQHLRCPLNYRAHTMHLQRQILTGTEKKIS